MVSTNSKIDYAALVVAYRKGDLSLSKFCEKHNVSTTTMNYYLYGKSKKKKKSNELVKLHLSKPADRSSSCLVRIENMELELRDDNMDLVLEFFKRVHHA